MRDSENKRDFTNQIPWRIPHLEALLLILLVVGWLLIFAAASLGQQRSVRQWLPVSLAPRAFADYGVDQVEAARLAPVRPQIIDELKQDSGAGQATPVTALAGVPTTTVIPTLTPTVTRTRPLVLEVDAGGPYYGDEGSSVPLVASSKAKALTYRWDLDNDGEYDDAKGASAFAIFFDEGEYPIGIQVSNLLGRVATDTATVNVANLPPVVRAGRDRTADEGESVAFSATARDPGHDVLLVYWDFGDGTGATGTLNPRHTYLDNENYLVRLRVDDNDGGTTEVFFITSVLNVPPFVDAGPDQVTTEGATVLFSGSAADQGVLDVLSYAWDFDFNGVSFTPDAFGRTASTVYFDGPASIVAVLRVRDEDGGQTMDAVNVTVNNVVPLIASVTNNGPVGEGSPLNLAVSATDVGSDTLTYAFDWENDGVFDALNQPASVSHIWYNQGSYTVRIRADDGDGGQAFTTTTVSALNVAPTAVVGPVAMHLEGSSILFDGSGSSDPGIYDPLTYQWNFGDGSPVTTGISVTHAYADNNIYNAALTVTDDSGATGNSVIPVTILNANPTANAGSDRLSDEGVPLNLVAIATDPGAADTLSVAWDFNYDGTSFTEDATGPSVNYTYPDGPASYAVALRVRDDDYPYPTGGGGEVGEAIDTLQVNVINVPPVADANGPYTAREAQSVTLSGSGLDVLPDTLSYAWDLDNNGVFEIAGQNVITSWNTAGIYSIRLRVTDKDGGIGYDTTQVTIGNAPPTADAGGPYTGAEGNPVVLTGSGSDPTGDPLTYTWDLDYDTIFESPGQVVTYTWPTWGVYSVTLRVDDGRGGVATDEATVTINSLPPTVDAGGPYSGDEGVLIILTGSAVDPTGDPLTYTWDLNYDGIFETPGQIVSYAWPDDGTYLVTLQADDGRGGVATDDATVVVNNVDPVVDSGGPYTGTVGITVTLVSTATDVPADPLSYAWDLDDDGFFDDAIGQVATYVWTTTGIYTVVLQVDDGDGGVVTDATTVDVSLVFPFTLGVSYLFALSRELIFSHRRREETQGQPRDSDQGYFPL